MSHLLAPPILAALLCGALVPALAQQDRREPLSPPPEAFTACQGKTEGAAVTLTMPDGKTFDGTCRTVTTSSGTALAARPNQPPRPHN